jgi:glycosyltransferase involved in cell wall biosynthesis
VKVTLTGQVSLRQLVDLVDDSTEIPDGLGGNQLALQTRALIERGHDVSLVTLDPDLTSGVVLRGDRLNVYVGPYRRNGGARDGYRLERHFVKEALLRCRPDVVHAHWTYEFALGALASGLPTVVTTHDAPLKILRQNLPKMSEGSFYRQLPTAAHWSIRTAMAFSVARRAPYLIAVSPYLEHHFRRTLRYQGKVAVIPNMMPPILFRPIGSARQLPNEGSRFLTILSSWSALKNGQRAIEAFAKVRSQLPLASLQMIGRGFEPGGPAENWATTRGFDAGVTFVGPLPNSQVFDYLADSDILVHPSLEESFGNSIAEAQLVGVPVIGGVHSGAVPWTLNYGQAGRLVDVSNATILAGAMTELALDSAARSKLALAGAELAQTRHDSGRLIIEIEGVLNAAVGDNSIKGDWDN